MKFGLEKYGMFIMRSGKRQITEEIDLPNQERIRTRRKKENDKYLRILEADTIKQAEIKEKKNNKRVPRTNEKASRNQTQQQKSKISSKGLTLGLYPL